MTSSAQSSRPNVGKDLLHNFAKISCRQRLDVNLSAKTPAIVNRGEKCVIIQLDEKLMMKKRLTRNLRKPLASVLTPSHRVPNVIEPN